MPTLYLRKNSEKGVAQNPLTMRVYPLNCIGWVKYDLHNKTAIKHDKFVFFFYLFSQMLREMTKKCARLWCAGERAIPSIFSCFMVAAGHFAVFCCFLW